MKIPLVISERAGYHSGNFLLGGRKPLLVYLIDPIVVFLLFEADVCLEIFGKEV